MAIIKPGIPQIYPHSINITNMVIIFIENDFPIKIGSKIEPNNTWTPVIESIKKNKELEGSNWTNARTNSKYRVIKNHEY